MAATALTFVECVVLPKEALFSVLIVEPQIILNVAQLISQRQVYCVLCVSLVCLPCVSPSCVSHTSISLHLPCRVWLCACVLGYVWVGVCLLRWLCV